MHGVLSLLSLVLGPAALSVSPALSALRIDNGGPPFAGDRRLLATVSPNGDSFRDVARIHFRLNEAARVVLTAVRTETAAAGDLVERPVWQRSVRLAPGDQTLVWRPARSIAPRTYILRVAVSDRRGRTAVYDNAPGAPPRAPVVRIQGIDAGFTQRSYAPGQAAELRVATDARSLTLQVFAYMSILPPTGADLKTNGRAMTGPIPVDWSAHRNGPASLRVVRAGDWPSGLYFVRLQAADGRVGYAPFIVRPRRLGAHRVAVVLSTNTWAAYNLQDTDGDGWGDSWYVSGRNRTVGLNRPFLDFGVPFRFHDWDLTFIDWLNKTGKQVDYLSDDDLERVANGSELARRYDLIVFPGHEEYVTTHVYDVITRYRDLGGNLAFLAANNFFRRVDRHGAKLTLVGLWRALGRPEAGLVGAQYIGSNHGAHQAGFVVTGAPATRWAFAGTGLAAGDDFGSYGIEIDAVAAASPKNTQVLARIPNLLGPGRTAEMTYYETADGAKVFAAGALDFAASVERPAVSRLLENLWQRLSAP